MEDFKDLNELITVAKQINEGKYDLININVDPANELFEIANYFNESLKKLKTVSSAVGKSSGEISTFEKTLKSAITDSKQATEDVLTYVDNINFNIDEIKEVLIHINAGMQNGDATLAAAHLDRVKDMSIKGHEICYDIISSLEFQEISKKKLENVLNIILMLQDQLAGLVLKLGLKQQVIDPGKLENAKDAKEILQDQTLVNKLLKEFGL